MKKINTYDVNNKKYTVITTYTENGENNEEEPFNVND